jgi:protein SCO1/2
MKQSLSQSITELIRAYFRIVLLVLLLFLQALTIKEFWSSISALSLGDERNLSKVFEPERYRRSEHYFSLSDFEMKDQNGHKISLREALGNKEGIMLNFIFTTCTTLCPVMSASFARVQEKLGPERNGLRLISISIDPDHDTPQHLIDYWRRFGAGTQWQLLTGSREDVIAIQKAFDVYLGKKSSHQSVMFLKGTQKGPWVRLEGYPSTLDIIAEYDRLNGRCRSPCP